MEKVLGMAGSGSVLICLIVHVSSDPLLANTINLSLGSALCLYVVTCLTSDVPTGNQTGCSLPRRHYNNNVNM